jgi:hypothetical protein
MLIAGFGDTYATAEIFPTNMPEDDWTLQRPAAARRVPFAGGAYDFNGANRDALAAYTVRKKFIQILSGNQISATDALTVDEGSIICSIVAGSYTTANFRVSDTIEFYEHGGSGLHQIRTITEIVDGTTFKIDHASVIDFPISDVASYTITLGAWYLDTLLETLKRAVLGIGESKLWLDMRDGSRRWAWAKCTKFSAGAKVEDRIATAIELEFYLREGVWYSETLHTQTMSGSSGNATLVNAGNIATAVKATVHAGSANITAASVGGKWAFSGTLLAGNDLIVDAARFSAKNNGVGCYGNMTITDPTAVWFLLDTGSHTFTLSWTGGGTGDTFGVEWYDAWV